MNRSAAQPLEKLTPAERFNFLVTNRLPRRWLTLLMGRVSKSRNPIVRWLLINMWQLFVDDLRLFEARKKRFDSLHDCFVRELKDGARSVDDSPDVVVSPCDAVVGEFGHVRDMEALQAKGFPYSIRDLLVDDERASRYRDGIYVTLRLKSSMYHRFHAPFDGHVHTIEYVSGDTWNVNPIALKVIEQLFCKNERAVVDMQVSQGAITLVPVAAILVASMQFHGLHGPLTIDYAGPKSLKLDRSFSKGDEMGYFEHGSTVVLFASKDYAFTAQLVQGEIIRMGQPLLSFATAP